MQSVLEEIAKLRNGAPMIIDYHNSNRYRLVVQENNGTKTAYYFSTPIYNAKSKKMVDMTFHPKEGAFFVTGSNANITISNRILMENAEGSCSIELPQKCDLALSQELHCGNLVLIPTTNGIALKCAIKSNEKITLIVDVGQPFLNVRANNRCFALMKEKFKPFVVLSTTGSLDACGNVIAPARIEYQKLTDRKYEVAIFSTSPIAQQILFETNLYENKLFQDTTVESMNPSTNNAFGSICFIGTSLAYGEQWLYSRVDYSRIFEVKDKCVQKIILHIPKLNQSDVDISAFKITARFCSFGSNWDNKISNGSLVANSITINGYQSLDVTSLLVEPRSRTILNSEGLILKSKFKGSGFSAIATGDSYLTPQILEINYK